MEYEDNAWRVPWKGYWLQTATHYGRVRETFGSNLPDAPQTILDFGCSSGFTSLELADIYPRSRVIGLEMDPIERGELSFLRSNLRFVQADGYRAPFRDGTFDMVVCINSLYHCLRDIPDDILTQRLHQITCLVRDDGLLLFGGETNFKGRHEFFIARNRAIVSSRMALTDLLRVQQLLQ